MKIIDKVYGEVEINDPLLVRLIKSEPMQRLKGVMQGGSAPLIDPRINVTRFEHSVGVMILLRTYDAPLEEQVAGLLHDVGHAAFSHVVDAVFKQYNHNYDDAHQAKVIQESKIPEILEKHGIDWRKIIQKESFTLLEKPLPQLCADRIDYVLRDSAFFVSENQRKRILENLTQYKGEFAFKTYESAREFADIFRELNKELYESPRHGLAYQILAEALAYALEKKAISETDLRLTDQELFEKIKKIDDPRIQANIAKLTPALQGELDAQRPDYTHSIKIRQIDPLIYDGMRALYLSQIDTPLRDRLERIKAHPHQELPIRITET